jgi:hypothetical protein
MLRLTHLVAIAVTALAPALAAAQLTQLTSRTPLTGGTFNFATVNAGTGEYLVGASLTSSVSLTGFTIARTAAQSMLLMTQGVGVFGMFAPGERLLFSGLDAEPLTFTFTNAIFGFGLGFHPNFFGPFTGSAEFFNGATSLGTVSINSTTERGVTPPPFLGATSAVAFNRVVLSAPVSGQFGLLMNGFSINTTTVVPEPSTYVTLATGLVALGVAARRRRIV